MNGNIVTNEYKRKRATRNRRKIKKKRKLTSLKHAFKEENFDFSDENDFVINEKLASTKTNNGSGESELIPNVSPSKSESGTNFIESQFVENSHTFISEELNDSSEDWSRFKFEELSDGEDSFAYENILHEFSSKTDSTKCEVVAANVGEFFENSIVNYIEPQKKIPEKKIRNQLQRERVTIKSENFISSNKKLTNNLFDYDAQCYHRNDGIMVILENEEVIYFNGLCLLSVLHGEVEILGDILNKNSPEAEIYSPRGSSLLYIKNVTQSESVPVTDYLLTLKNPQIRVGENSAIIFCRILNDPQINFIEKHISQQILPKIQDSPRVVFQPKEGHWNLLKVNPNWDNIIAKIKMQTKLIICGGKGVGKSTFLRFAINRLLKKFKEIRVIDLDPGQPEFTVPGCISIVRVTKPILGVNYTHLQKTERSILSNISISYEPDKYISSVKQLINTELDEIPTLINYMGFTQGIGLNILSAVICCIQPTDVLQISSSNAKKNFRFILENDIIVESAKLFIKEVPPLNFCLHQTESMCDQNESWTAEPRALREMTILAYISQMIKSDSIFRSRAPVYKINLNDVILSDLNGELIEPAAINACMVILCRLDDETQSIFECLSWGIVRGIDLIANVLVLVTSEDIGILNKVTHLVSNNGVTLPPSVYMTPDDVKGAMPYVIEGTLMSLGQITKRSRISAKKTV